MADLDRLLREQNPEPGQPRVPVPQYQKVDGVGFERVTGRHGGAHSVLLGPDGRPISSDNRLPVEVAGEVGITGGSIGVTGNVGITGGAASNLQIIADNQGRLYGRTASGSWLPVRVNSSGQLELAQNVVIDNVTVNVGAEVKVNNDESEPVPVQLSGTIVEKTILVNQQEIRDTETFFVPNLDALVDRYVSWDIKIEDTHYTVLGQGGGAVPACRWGLFMGTFGEGSNIIADSGRAYRWTMGGAVHSASVCTVEWPGYTNGRTNNTVYITTYGLSLKDVLVNADMKFYQHFDEQLEERFSNRQLFVDRLFSPDYRVYFRGHRLAFKYLEAPIGGSITLTLVGRLR